MTMIGNSFVGGSLDNVTNPSSDGFGIFEKDNLIGRCGCDGIRGRVKEEELLLLLRIVVVVGV